MMREERADILNTRDVRVPFRSNLFAGRATTRCDIVAFSIMAWTFQVWRHGKFPGSFLPLPEWRPGARGRQRRGMRERGEGEQVVRGSDRKRRFVVIFANLRSVGRGDKVVIGAEEAKFVFAEATAHFAPPRWSSRHGPRWRRISDRPGRDAAHPCRGKPPHHCIGSPRIPSQRVYISPPRPRAVTRYRFRGRPSFTLLPRARTAARSLKVTVSESASARARPFFPILRWPILNWSN